MANFSEDDLLPLSGLQHLAYCPRQFALIHIEQVWEENRFTAEGQLMHRRVNEHTLDAVTELPGSVEIPEWHKMELNKRLKTCPKNPNDRSSWQDVKKRIVSSTDIRKTP